jgi:excinuclease ABC subunit B
LVDPEITVKPTSSQIDDLIKEIKVVTSRGERVLVTTLTKRMAEDLADYLVNMGLKVRYLHSEIDTLERIEILRELRLGEFDVLVGINLLREGLDLPEVSLVAVLDADKEGFLRSETTLIQVFGRCARNVNARVIMYADKLTGSMKRAIDETQRRRSLQLEYNKKHHITPKTIIKPIYQPLSEKEKTKIKEVKIEYKISGDIKVVIKDLEERMREAADNLQYELAAKLRDEIFYLKDKIKT